MMSNNIEDIVELSPMQTGMLYNSMLSGHKDYYVEHLLHLTGNIVHTTVRATLELLASRHPLLRASVVSEEVNKPMLVIVKENKIDFRFSTTESGEYDLQSWLLTQRAQTFDLQNGPLWKVRLLYLDGKYKLFWAYHHISLDGWSFISLVEEFFIIYNSLHKNGVIPALPERTSYKSYLAWSRRQNSSSAKAYWEKFFEGYEIASSIVPWLRFKKEHGGKTTLLSYHKLTVSNQITTAINELRKRYKVTSNTYLQVIWGILLSKYNSVTDSIFGTTVSGRSPNLEGSESIVGMLINTVPIRVSYQASTTFVELLKQIQIQYLSGLEHHHYPLNKILSLTSAKQNLLDHITVFENFPANQNLLNEIDSVIRIEHQEVLTKTNFDLTVEFNDEGGEYNVVFGYNPAIIDPERLDQLSNQFEYVIKQTLQDPLIHVAGITLVSHSPENEITIEESRQTISGAFEDQIIKTPDRPAITDGEIELTYQQFNNRVNSLASLLTTKYGIAPDQRVGIVADRSLEMICSVMAVLKAGASYVPINIEIPSSRQKFIVEDTDLSLILTTKKNNYSLDFLGLPIVTVDDSSDRVIPNPARIANSSSVAYIIHTSGSSGIPKGVMVEHGGVVNMALSQIEMFGISPDDHVLQFAPLSFDASVSEMLMALLSGAKLILAQDEIIKDPDLLISYAAIQRVTVVTFPPSYWSAFETSALAYLRIIISAGEKMPVELLSKHPDQCLFNAYGPTEYSVCVSIHRAGDINRKTVPIGVPIANTFVHVMDDSLHLLPDGLTGELCFGGAGLARGYLNNPELTHEKFIINKHNGRRMFRSGDLGWKNEDGLLEYTSRKDDQVKINGHRIEIGEIEFHLQRHPGVKQAVVLVDKEWNNSLRAFVLLDSTHQNTGNVLSAIKQHISGILPGYMVPKTITVVPHMPVTIHGKVDTFALLRDRPVMPATRVEQISETEQKILSVWKEVLGNPGIGLHDDYFESGGDSMIAIRMIAKLKKENILVSIRDLVSHPTVFQLAALEKGGSRVHRQNDFGNVPLSPVQKFLFSTVSSSESLDKLSRFNFSIALNSKLGFDRGKVERAFNILMHRHEALSFEYRWDGTQVIQASKAMRGLAGVYWIDRSDKADVNTILLEEHEKALRRIDLTSGVLFIPVIVSTVEGERLLLIFHHAIMDIISLQVFLDEFAELYKQEDNNHNLQRRSSSFRRWSISMEEYYRTGNGRQSFTYWENQSLVAVDELIKTNEVLPGEFRQLTMNLSQEISNGIIHDVTQYFNTSPHEILLSALTTTIRKVFSNDKFLIQVEGHGRSEVTDEVDVSETIGWFTTAYPILFDVSNAKSMDEMLLRVSKIIRNVPEKGVGYGYWQQEITNHTPVKKAQVNFNFDGIFQENSSSHPFSIHAGKWENSVARLDPAIAIYVNITALQGQLTTTIQYAGNLIADQLAQQIMETFRATLSRMAAIGHQPSTNSEAARYPLSPMQTGLLFIHLKDDTSRDYHIQSVSRFSGPLNISKLQDAFHFLVKKYEVLRTSFHIDENGNPFQSFRDASQNSSAHITVKEENELALEELIRNDLENRFDILGDKPLFRISVLRVSQDDHFLLWSFHHIIMDSWCLGIIVRELLNAYDAKSLVNKSPALFKDTLYSDYLKWLTKYNKDKALAFWKTYLIGFEATAKLVGAIGSRRISSTESVKTYQLSISQKKTESIRQIAVRRRTTTPVFLEMIWSILLSKYCNTKDVVFGKILNGRPEELDGVDQMVGLFINTVPQRVQMKSGANFEQLLSELADQQAMLRKYQFVSLADIQQQTVVNSDLFDHLIEFETNADQSFPQISELKIASGETRDKVHYNFNVMFAVAEKIQIEFRYNPGAFEEVVMQQLLTHFDWVIDQVIADPAIPIEKIQLMTDKERLSVDELNLTSTLLPDLSVCQIFQQIAAERPHDVAVTSARKTLSYIQLEIRSNQLAHALIANGLRRGEIVAVIADRSLEFIVAFLAIQKTGNIYLPVDPGTPPQRIRQIVEDSQASLAITNDVIDASLQQLLTELKVPVFSLVGDDLWEKRLDLFPSVCPAVNILPSDVAYVIYTSGSTGKPKGAIVEQIGMLNHLLAKIKICSIGPSSVIAQNASHTFDISIWQMMAALLCGGRVVLIDNDTVLNPDRFLTIIQNEKINVLEVVPSYMEMLLEIADTNAKDIINNINYLLITGEKPSLPLVRNLLQTIPHPVLINAYGPTEASDDVTHAILTKTSIINGIPVGKPIHNMRVYILDQDMNFCPVGVKGKLYVSGIGVGRGYLNDAAKTSRVFSADPLVSGERMYNTGDMARYLPNYDVEYVGREDAQVKVNGNRIELIEIELCLHDIEGITGAVVELLKYENGSTIIAFITTEKKQVHDSRSVLSLLSSSLPDFMLPGELVFLDKFPLTRNGKIDRQALVADRKNASQQKSFDAPVSKTEIKLGAIWRPVLNREFIGTQENFFEIGGHSLKALQLVSRIEKQLHVHVSIRDLFANPTISSLARYIELQTNEAIAQIQPIELRDYYVVSHPQKRLWILDRIITQRNIYNISSTVELHGSVNLRLMEKAFFYALERHESLRTNFISKNGSVFQVIRTLPDFFEISTYDLSIIPDNEKELRKIVVEHASREFDLENDRLFRVHMVKISEDKHVLILVLHHIITDGWSMGVLSKEILESYQSLHDNTPIIKPPLAVQYKDFASWQNEFLNSNLARNHREFWLHQFEDIGPGLTLPIAAPRPVVKTYYGDSHQFNFDEASTIIRDFSSKSQVTVFATIMAGLNTLFYKYSGNEDIIVGFTSSGRMNSVLEDQVGYFINTLALRTRFSGEVSFDNLVHTTQENILSALEHQDYPFDKLIEDIKLERDPTRMPLFDVLVEYQHKDLYAMSGDPVNTMLEVLPHHVDVGVSKFDLTFFILDSASGIEVIIEYNTDLFEAAAIERMSAHFKQLLTIACLDPTTSIGTYPLLLPTEQEVLQQFNSELIPVNEQDVLEQFQQCAKDYPDQIAVRSESGTLTYSELNDRATRFAAFLKTQYALNPGDVIPVLMDNSPDLITAIIGILLTGCAFLPLNPSDPDARKKFILSEIKPKLLVTDSDHLYEIQNFFDGHFIVLDIQLPLMPVAEFSAPDWQPNRLAYVIYTSGTTGNPKGVKIGIASLSNYISWANRYYFNNSRDESFALLTSPSFDLTLTSIFSPLSRGAEMVIFNGSMDQILFDAFNGSRKVNALKLTPSHLALIRKKEKVNGYVHLIILGGEPVKSNHLKKIHEMDPSIRIFNEYGPTETTVGCTAMELFYGKEISVGKPITGAQIHILDTQDQIQPLEIYGEVCVNGLCLGLGYVNSALDVNKFAYVTMNGNPVRIYRTGDKGRWMKNGNLQVIGRLDRQTKRNGFRIELDDIENAMMRHNGIDACAVVSAEVEENQEIIGYFQSHEELTLEAMRSFLLSSLPAYFVPDKFVRLDQIPLTTNGKIDYKKLPDPLGLSIQSSINYVAPFSDTEKRLAGIWQTVLGLEQVGIHDDFFKLGGNSLKVIQVVNSFDPSSTGILQVTDLFQTALLGELAKLIDQRQGSIHVKETIETFDI